jgi:hypothetical protein
MLRSPHILVAGFALASLFGCDGLSAGGNDSTCGNGTVEGDEECDVGAFNGAPDGFCSADCKLTNCGDGVLNPGSEECDDGDSNADIVDACRTTCTLPRCGDGIDDSGEACDSGDANSTEPDACRPDCTLPTCGDGIVDTGEDCDLGDLNSDAPNATCRADCGLRRCGDGVQDDGEACDAGIANGNAANACRATCALPNCGDGVVDTGEQCDSGQGNSWSKDACRPTCELAACGDGIVDTGEVCDGRGETATCNANCTPWRCGDGILNRTAGEECDQFTVVANGWCELGCHVACASTFGDCNDNGEDGCETTFTTDPFNCGFCGHDCGGGTCVGGSCRPVQLADLPESTGARIIYADGSLAVGAPLVDGSDNIIGGGTVLVPPDARGTGSATMSNAVGYSAAWTITGGSMVGLLWYPGLALPYVFGKTSLTTGITEEIVPLTASTAFVYCASDGASIYWAAQDRSPSPYQDAIWQYTFGDPAPALVADYRPTQGGIASFNKTVANDRAVFTQTGGPSEIWRVELPPAAPAPLKVGTPSDSLYALAASGDWLVFTTPAGISKIPAACTGPASCLETTVMASGGKILLPLVIDDTHVYWAEHTTAVIGGSGIEPSPIKRISLASGVVETMVPNAINVTDMVAVGDHVYWPETAVGPAVGKVWKLAK